MDSRTLKSRQHRPAATPSSDAVSLPSCAAVNSVSCYLRAPLKYHHLIEGVVATAEFADMALAASGLVSDWAAVVPVDGTEAVVVDAN